MSCYYNNITSYDIDYRYNNVLYCVYYDNTDKTLLFSYDTHMSLLDIIRVAVPILDHQVLKPKYSELRFLGAHLWRSWYRRHVEKYSCYTTIFDCTFTLSFSWEFNHTSTSLLCVSILLPVPFFDPLEQVSWVLVQWTVET